MLVIYMLLIDRNLVSRGVHCHWLRCMWAFQIYTCMDVWQSVLSTDEIDLETSAAFGFSSRYRTALAESLDIYIASIRSQCKIVSGVFCTENDVNTSLTILITSRGGASKSMWYGAIYSQYSVDIPNIRSSDALPVNIKVILTISFWPQPLLVSRDI
eukprot:GHVO01044878.1.p1 GENE.GHVO01044878.1~~GHVO01044878.1.p1  ORF type:complete len:157 (+),score=2.59 GHVO01044878.1:41-511(+)